jgi:AraC-like DNA-binding protein
VVCEQHELDVKSFPKWLKYLDKKYYSTYSDPHNKHATLNGGLPPRTKEINKVLRYVEQNLHKEVREEDVAALCHYSASYFSKYFRKHLGVCFRDYLIEKRLTLAKDLLKNQPNVKIAYIAYQCGYQDISYFARIFKKRVGVSPATYRQQYLKAKTSIHHKSA